MNPDLSAVADLLRDGLAAGHMPYLTVSSQSMTPLLRVGDQIGVQQVTLDQLNVGDVVVVRRGSLLLTHRFAGVHRGDGGKQFVTRGDRVCGDDPLWQESDLFGRAVARRRGAQQLWLDFGRGRWLNRSLAKVAHLEQQLLQRFAPGAGERARRFPEKLICAISRIAAAGLTRAVELTL